MKKNILYTMQSVQLLFCIFLNCCQTILTKIYLGKMTKNKILSSHLLLFISLFFSVNTYSQLVDPGAIRANFGVDGDAYGNFQGFTIITPPGSTTPPSVTIGVDDWFVNKTPPPDSLGVRSPYWDGTGLNVIDQRDGATLKAAIQANNNYSFTRRQSRPPLSIVVSTVNGVPTPYLWIDAVYGRDNNSAQSNSDATIFTSTSDKNPDNPTTYNIGSGSVPQKDDIIDVMAHLRGEGPKNPTAQDPRPFTTLYAYGAATLRATSGSKHIDFEFYRTLVEATGSTLTNTGLDGGRTAFTFNPDGSLNKPGTIIVSIDYEGGGTKPDVRIRVWMSKASFDALLLNPSARPFNVVAGSFEQGLSGGDFGYARITALTEASASIWGRVNSEGSTLAAPWGTLEGSTANMYEEYQTLQHVEIGINLTAFNLDRKDESDPCSNILGSLLVKTRSCAGGNNDPFSCELKDFAGPYAFGFTVKPEVVLAVDRVITCANPSATITASGVKPNGAPIEFYGPDPTPLDKTDGLGPLIAAEDAAPDFNRTVTAGGVYAVVVTAPGLAGCTATSYITVEEDKALPSASDSHTDVSCNGGNNGSVTINFNGGTGPYEVSFNGGGFVTQTSPKVYTGLAAGTYSWVVRGANGCSVSGSETISEPTALLASDAHTNVSCNGGTDGSVTVTFSGGTAPYMVNFNGGGFEAQTSPKAYTGLAAGTYSWVVKDANGCEQSGSETISEPTALLASDAHTNVSCNGGTDGSVTVTFSGGTAPYMVNFNGGGFMAQTSPKAYTGLAAGTYSWVVKDANGCEQSGSETISEPTALLASDAHTEVTCLGFMDGSVTLTFSGGTAPYMVNFNGGGFEAQTSPKTYSGLGAGTYTWVVKDANGCEMSGSEIISEGPSCGGQLCTYTQGAFGNYGGKYCDGTIDGIATIDLITKAITNAGGSIVVGKSGASVIMSLGDENCIIKQLPGGGKATEIFPAGDYDICPSLPNSFLKTGKINNVLLSQTITLSLNVNITQPSQLGGFVLQAGTLATAKPDGGCGSSIAKQRICGHFEGNVWVNTVNEYTYRTFSAAVINAIIPDGNNNRTIAGLLDLANRALANVDGVKNSENGVSLSEIAGAVAAVNEVFDKCAIAVGWDLEKCPEPPTLDLSGVTTAKISSTEVAGFTAYPVPFVDQLTIRYDFDYVSDVKIEVFNSKGIIVYSMIDSGSYFGKEVTIFINNTLEQQQVYYVRLTTNQGSTVKSVMSSY